MSDKKDQHPEVRYLKRFAKTIKNQEPNISHSQALEYLAKKRGFNSWTALIAHYQEKGK